MHCDYGEKGSVNKYSLSRNTQVTHGKSSIGSQEFRCLIMDRRGLKDYPSLPHPYLTSEETYPDPSTSSPNTF